MVRCRSCLAQNSISRDLEAQTEADGKRFVFLRILKLRHPDCCSEWNKEKQKVPTYCWYLYLYNYVFVLKSINIYPFKKYFPKVDLMFLSFAYLQVAWSILIDTRKNKKKHPLIHGTFAFLTMSLLFRILRKFKAFNSEN